MAFVSATPGIFEALGVTIVAGRSFADSDDAAGPPVAVVNETAARTLFGSARAVGRRITLKRQDTVGEPPQLPREWTIVGVASDSDAGVVGRREDGVIYVPWSQQFDGRVVFAVRTSGDPAERLGDLRQALATAAPDLAVAQMGTGEAVAGPSNLFAGIAAGVAGSLGAFGLLLALAGLMGVLSHLVSRRTREIGVRLALGATASQARRLVLGDGLRPVLIGIAVGIALAAAAQQSLELVSPMLVPPLDITALAVLAGLLTGAGALACYLPARRASRIDPAVALRDL
jgi:putative ABC transport system permease protein